MPVIRRLAAGLALAAMGACPIAAAEFEDWARTGDWYLAVGVAPTPDVSEDGKGPNGSSTYDWKDTKDNYAPRLAIGYLACSGGVDGGWALSGELVGTTCDVTPKSYTVGGLDFPNTSSRSLRYSTLGVTIAGGYEFGINNDNDNISTFFLLMPFVGAGGAYADSEVRDQNGTYDNGSGIGWYVEGGLRGGFFITERHWLLGAMVDLAVSTGKVDIDFGGGNTSTLTHERRGVGASLVVGYRL